MQAQYPASSIIPNESGSPSMSTEPIRKLAPIQRLPTELLLELSEYLPAHSVVVLSLTCKGLYLNKDLRRTWKDALSDDQRHSAMYLVSGSLGGSATCLQTQSLTRLLEKDMPSYFSCDICSRLHPQRDPPKSMSRAECNSWAFCSRYPTRGTWLHYDTWNLRLSLEYLRQAYSRNTGTAAQFIADNTFTSDWLPHTYNDRPWKEKLDLVPVVHDEILIMHACQRISFNKKDVGPGNSCIQPNTISSALEPCQCPRGTNNTDLRIKVASMLDRAFWQTGIANTAFGFERCKNCLAQYSVNLHEDKKGVLVISLDAWTTVGSLRRHFDAKQAIVPTLSYPGDYLTLITMSSPSDDPSPQNSCRKWVLWKDNKPQATGLQKGTFVIPQGPVTVEPTVKPPAGPMFEAKFEGSPEVRFEASFEARFGASFGATPKPGFKTTPEPTEPSFEPTVEPTVGPAVIPIVEHTKSVVEPVVGPMFGPMFGPMVECMVKPMVELMTECRDEPGNKPETGLAMKPMIEPKTDPMIGPTAFPPSYESLQFRTDPVTQPVDKENKQQIEISPPPEKSVTPPTPEAKLPAPILHQNNERGLRKIIEAMRGMFAQVTNRKHHRF